jgi:hypothetical protein
MNNLLKKVLPIAAGAAGSAFGMPWLGAAAGALLQGGSNNKISQSNQGYDKQAYADALRYNRPNQQNASGATSNWAQDPTSGAWTQTQQFGPEEQKRRDMFNQIAMSRMQNAGQMKLPDLSQGINYNSWSMPKYPTAGNDLGASALGVRS